MTKGIVLLIPWLKQPPEPHFKISVGLPLAKSCIITIRDVPCHHPNSKSRPNWGTIGREYCTGLPMANPCTRWDNNKSSSPLAASRLENASAETTSVSMMTSLTWKRRMNIMKKKIRNLKTCMGRSISRFTMITALWWTILETRSKILTLRRQRRQVPSSLKCQNPQGLGLNLWNWLECATPAKNTKTTWIPTPPSSQTSQNCRDSQSSITIGRFRRLWLWVISKEVSIKISLLIGWPRTLKMMRSISSLRKRRQILKKWVRFLRVWIIQLSEDDSSMPMRPRPNRYTSQEWGQCKLPDTREWLQLTGSRSKPAQNRTRTFTSLIKTNDKKTM